MAKPKPWLDKYYMHDRYVLKKWTIDKIAEECTNMGYKVTPMTIYNNLKTLGLIRNGRNLGQRSVGGNSKKKGFYG